MSYGEGVPVLVPVGDDADADADADADELIILYFLVSFLFL